MSRDVRAIFAAIDAYGQDKFVTHLSPDVVFRFGNADPAVGREQVKEASTGFLSGIAGLTHHVQHVYQDGDTAKAKIDVEYRRHHCLALVEGSPG